MVVGAPYVPSKQIFYGSDGTGRDSYVVSGYGGTIKDFQTVGDFHKTYRTASPPASRRPQSHRSPRSMQYARDEARHQRKVSNFLSQPRDPRTHSLPRRAATARGSSRSARHVPRSRVSCTIPETAPRQQRVYPTMLTTCMKSSKQKTAEWNTMSQSWLPTNFVKRDGLMIPELETQCPAGVHSTILGMGYEQNQMLQLTRNKMAQSLSKSMNHSVYGPYLSRETDDAFGLMYRPPTMEFFEGAREVSPNPTGMPYAVIARG